MELLLLFGMSSDDVCGICVVSWVLTVDIVLYAIEIYNATLAQTLVASVCSSFVLPIE
jgi:hypothetical protein